jgi:DNA polymerase III epsilon subunit-like protein
MVAHNAAFDYSFLDLEFRRIFGGGIRNPVLCTLRLLRRLLPSLKSKRLDALAEHFGLATDGRHRGWGGARMTAELLAILLEMAAKMGIARLDRLLDWDQRGAAGSASGTSRSAGDDRGAAARARRLPDAQRSKRSALRQQSGAPARSGRVVFQRRARPRRRNCRADRSRPRDRNAACALAAGRRPA